MGHSPLKANSLLAA